MLNNFHKETEIYTVLVKFESYVSTKWPDVSKALMFISCVT